MSPILGSASGARAFGLFSVKGAATLGGSDWVKVLGITGVTTGLYNSAPLYTSGAGAYFVGETRSSGNQGYQVIKMTSSGGISWQRSYIAGINNTTYDISVSAFNTVYVSGSGSYSYYSADPLMIKYSSTGTLSWQKGYPVNSQGDGSGSRYHATQGVSSDFYTGSEILYGATTMQPVVGTSYTSGIVFGNYSASTGAPGAISKLLASSDANTFIEATSADSSSQTGHIYVVGNIQNYSGSTGKDTLVVKYQVSNGAVAWSRTIGTAATEGDGAKIAIDANDDVFIATPIYGGSNPGVEVIKLSGSTGTLVWSKRLTTGVNYAFSPTNVSVDGSGDVYVSGTHYTDGAKLFIAKYSGSDGSILFQRSLTIAGGILQRTGASTSFNNYDMYIHGQTTAFGGMHSIAGKLPFDGSKTGTYYLGTTTMTYAATSYTDLAGSLSVAATTGLVESNYSLPTSTSPGTSSTSTLSVLHSA